MYPNLSAELARLRMTIKDLSKKTDIPYQTLYSNINGTNDIKLKYCVKIREAISSDLTLDYLFQKEEV